MILIVLPAYNEAAGLPPLLNEIRAVMNESRLEYKVVVVDDGSSDGTWDMIVRHAQEMPIVPVRHEVNRGLAEALRSGLQVALSRAAPADVIVTMDADNTHAPGLVMRMLGLIREGHDVVIGSRYVAGARVVGVPFHRRVLSYSASLLMRAVFPITGVRDYTCGFRAYRASVLQAAFARYSEKLISQKGFSCMVDILLKLRTMDPIMGEVPLVLRYDLKHGMSKMRAARTIVDTLVLMARNLGGSSDGGRS
jgi:dolichol-phosphate mannosyltransferase